MNFTVYPAIDVRDGRVVRLRQGDYAQETRYGIDPCGLARQYADAGARWLHLVDLDAARSGGYSLAPLLRRIVAETPLQVQTGGGVRSRADVDRLFEAGAARVVVGSVAVRDPRQVQAWIGDYGADRVTVALDTKVDEAGDWRLPLHGWTESEGHRLDDVLGGYVDAGLKHLLCTDIARDGMLAGPNIGLYRDIVQLAPGASVQASGGARDIGDVRDALAAGCAGIVLGRALLEGKVELGEALAC
jgi:phosphoribosylformimino-5-aminoimidazole carboxamide ribotide isomerase